MLLHEHRYFYELTYHLALFSIASLLRMYGKAIRAGADSAPFEEVSWFVTLGLTRSYLALSPLLKLNLRYGGAMAGEV